MRQRTPAPTLLTVVELGAVVRVVPLSRPSRTDEFLSTCIPLSPLALIVLLAVSATELLSTAIPELVLLLIVFPMMRAEEPLDTRIPSPLLFCIVLVSGTA
jgi:hypothetical protein